MMGDVARPLRVLITGAGTATAISVLKALRRQNEIPVDIVVADAQQEVAGRYLADAFVQVPTAGDPDYVSTMVGVLSLVLFMFGTVLVLFAIVAFIFSIWVNEK